MSVINVPGFEPMDMTPRPRLVLTVDARQKRGKTRFVLTAPKPLAYINLDRGFESNAADLQTLADDTYVCDLSDAMQRVQPGKGKLGDNTLAQFKDVAEQAHQKLLQQFKLGLENFRSVAVDTTTRWWEVLRIARFGKMAQVAKQHYAEVNAEFERYLFMALGMPANLMLVHRQKREYKGAGDDGYWTGGYERAGYKDIDYIAHARITLDRLEVAEREDGDLGFRCLISDCATNPEADGVVLANDAINFLMVALTVRPDTSPDQWE